jgi:hypothetical protein
VDSPGVVKEVHVKSEAAFVADADDKARVWWNQSWNSEAFKEKAKERAAARSVPGEPAAKRLPPAPAAV